MIGVLVLLHAHVYILLSTFFALLLPEWRINVLLVPDDRPISLESTAPYKFFTYVLTYLQHVGYRIRQKHAQQTSRVVCNRSA